MIEAGIGSPDRLEADGRLHRFRGEGDRRENAWYILHADGRPAGAFGSWRLGVSRVWHAGGAPLGQAEQRAFLERIAAARQRADAERRRAWLEAAKRAWTLWQAAAPASPDNPYLRRKGIRPHHLRQSRGLLLAPLADLEGRVWNLQTIGPDGTKRFLRGGRTAGLACPFGALEEAEAVAIAEGVATAATVREATGLPVFAALSAHNLEPVARAVRRRLPAARIIIAADHDQAGLEHARRAAAAAGAEVIAPLQPDTDWNDAGPELARATFAKAGVPGVPGVLANEIKGLARDTMVGHWCPGVPTRCPATAAAGDTP